MTSKGNIKIGRQAALLLAVIVAALVFSSGVALAVTKTCVPFTGPGTECYGTRKADSLNGTDGVDIIYGRRGGDTLKGFGNKNQLFGQGGSDELFGGSFVDALFGGAGNDALSGGAGADDYYFDDGWGNDSLIDDATSDNELVFFSTNEGMVTTDDLIVDLTSSEGPEVRNASVTNTINWDGSVINDIESGAGDDHITGNASANQINSNSGSDTIYGGEGDDEIYVHDGHTEDAVHCGSGDDTVWYDATGFLSDSIDSDCEHLVDFS